jgi:hypothetical protein
MKKYEKISVSVLIDILSQHRQHIMIKLKYMQQLTQEKVSSMLMVYGNEIGT